MVVYNQIVDYKELKYFVVFQNQSFKEEHDSGILWAPKKDMKGNNAKFHWESLLSCKLGDIIFSVVKNKVVARGTITKEATECINPLNNDRWSREGWLVEIDYMFTDNDFKAMDNIDKFKHLLPDKYSPFNKDNGKGNQGYLYPISNELGVLFDELIEDTYLSNDLTSIYELDEDEETLVNEVLLESGLSNAEIILIEEEMPKESNKPKTKRKRVTSTYIIHI